MILRFSRAAQVSINEVGKNAEMFKNELMPLVDLETPVALEGLVNTWCLTFTIRNELAIVHYCQTVE